MPEKITTCKIAFADEDFKLLIQPDKLSAILDTKEQREVFHEDIEIKYFVEGSATLLIGSTPYTVSAGDIVVINPYEFHSTLRFGKDVGKYHLFIISLDFLDEGNGIGLGLRGLLFGGLVRFQTLIRQDARITDLLLRAVAEHRQNLPYRKAILRGLMLELFGLLLREYTDSGEARLAESDNFKHFRTVEPAIRRIRDGYSDKLTTDELASLCSITKSHFCRVFRLVTGMTATDYLTRYRLHIAD
ncbi:MAG: AraC family transcriptional regulator, partial [Ruminococcaceae bacterium]|nr:AraC family transcriptional regulator [Oscillospiraceae bacterium]